MALQQGGGGTNISILLEGFPSEDHVRTSLSNAVFCRNRQPLRCCPVGRGGEARGSPVSSAVQSPTAHRSTALRHQDFRNHIQPFHQNKL